MEQFAEFVSNHLFLSLTFVIVLTLLVRSLISGDGGKFSVTPARATEMINRENAIVVDVRSEADFKKGHIINAINIPAGQMANQLNKLNKYKNKPIVVSCRSGSTSQLSCKQLRSGGFEQVFNLQGGILAWESANLPVAR